MDLMQPLLSYGIRPSQLAGTLKELAMKTHSKRWLQHEHDTLKKRKFYPTARSEMFGAFKDKQNKFALGPT